MISTFRKRGSWQLLVFKTVTAPKKSAENHFAGLYSIVGLFYSAPAQEIRGQNLVLVNSKWNIKNKIMTFEFGSNVTLMTNKTGIIHLIMVHKFLAINWT